MSVELESVVEHAGPTYHSAWQLARVDEDTARLGLFNGTVSKLFVCQNRINKIHGLCRFARNDLTMVCGVWRAESLYSVHSRKDLELSLRFVFNRTPVTSKHRSGAAKVESTKCPHGEKKYPHPGVHISHAPTTDGNPMYTHKLKENKESRSLRGQKVSRLLLTLTLTPLRERPLLGCCA